MAAEGFRCYCRRNRSWWSHRRPGVEPSREEDPYLGKGQGPSNQRVDVFRHMAMGLVPGRSLLFTQELLALLRAITVGGSSILYYATMFDPPYQMFESRGIDIRPEVENIKRELPIAPLVGCSGGSGHPPHYGQRPGTGVSMDQAAQERSSGPVSSRMRQVVIFYNKWAGGRGYF